MTGDRIGTNGVDFAAIIERALSSNLRTELAEFLMTYSTLEFGTWRRIEPEEIALVLAAIDRFHVQRSFRAFRTPPLEGLYRSLGDIVAHENPFTADEHLQVRNLCFDTLACLKSFESHLRLSSYRLSPTLRLVAHPTAANKSS